MMIPTFMVQDIGKAAAFYTGVLDFERYGVTPEIETFYAVLTRGEDELHLSIPARPGWGRQTAIVVCDDVDALFAAFRTRGLPPSSRTDSPVHQGPVDQTWGTREVYVDDPDGNTLCFQQR